MAARPVTDGCAEAPRVVVPAFKRNGFEEARFSLCVVSSLVVGRTTADELADAAVPRRTSESDFSNGFLGWARAGTIDWEWRMGTGALACLSGCRGGSTVAPDSASGAGRSEATATEALPNAVSGRVGSTACRPGPGTRVG